jgi:hypothetical protein
LSTPATVLRRLHIKDIATVSAWGHVVFLGFALLIFWQASMTLRRASGDRPYGAGISWDEIATYNGARVVSGPYRDWTFRYGTLDTFIQILATQYFRLFDPVGPGEDHYAFSNNNLMSFTSRHVEFDGSLDGTAFGYSYFRGLDDHQPIFLARKIHLIATYGLAMLIGGLTIFYLGPNALLLLLPLCCLTVNTDMAAQTGLALPNAINTVIAFSVTALGFFAVAERRESCLYIGAALVAIALNMKIDAILLGGVLGLAILISSWRAGFAGLGRRVLLSGGIFALVYAVTNPQALIEPGLVFAQINAAGSLVGHSPLELAGTARQNLDVLRLFLEVNLLPWRISDGPAGMTPIGLMAIALAASAIVHWRYPTGLWALAIPSAALLLLWLYPMLTITILYPRYYLNGLGALYALIGAALVMAWRLGEPPARCCVLAILTLLFTQYGMLMRAHHAAAAQVQADTFDLGISTRRDRFARGFTRNQIERRAIEAWRNGGYDRTILVDQHGYFDLRMLRLAGMRPFYVNLFNIEEVLRGLDQVSDHLLLFSPGSYATDPSWWRPWETSWTPEVAHRYDAYRAHLDAFPVRDEIAGPPQRLLSAAPVAPDDHVVLAVIPHHLE